MSVVPPHSSPLTLPPSCSLFNLPILFCPFLFIILTFWEHFSYPANAVEVVVTLFKSVFSTDLLLTVDISDLQLVDSEDMESE